MEMINNSNIKYNASTMFCIQSAYEDLCLMIDEIFTHIKGFPNQLTFDEFILLFENYDWGDIILKVEDIDNWIDQDKTKSVYKLLNKSLLEDICVVTILGHAHNTYFTHYFNKKDPS
jgi:hypothetical protein